jgi:hypothetical protein
MGYEAANSWVFNYLSSFSIDFFIVQPISNYIKVTLYYFSINSNKFLAKIILFALKSSIENAINDEIF